MAPLSGSSGAKASYGTFGDTIDTTVGVHDVSSSDGCAVVLTGLATATRLAAGLWYHIV